MYARITDFINSHPKSEAAIKIDEGLLFVVKDAKKWHEDNYKLNTNEYCVNKPFSRLKDYLQREDAISYGVVSYNSLANIMINWDNFYLSSMLLKDVDFIQLTERDFFKSSYVLDTYFRHNRENAILVSLLANSELKDIEHLLFKILSLTNNDSEAVKEYIKNNYDDLVELFELEYDHDFYAINGDRIRLLYDKLKVYNKIVLPKTLTTYLSKKKVSFEDRKKVLLTTREYLKNKIINDTNNLNKTYNDKIVKSSSYALKK